LLEVEAFPLSMPFDFLLLRATSGRPKYNMYTSDALSSGGCKVLRRSMDITVHNKTE